MFTNTWIQDTNSEDSSPQAALALGTAKEIPLNKGLKAIVDVRDYNYLSQYKWRVINDCRKQYRVIRYQKYKPILMAHEVACLNGKPFNRVQHLNGNKLDNRWSNIAPVGTILNAIEPPSSHPTDRFSQRDLRIAGRVLKLNSTLQSVGNTLLAPSNAQTNSIKSRCLSAGMLLSETLEIASGDESVNTQFFVERIEKALQILIP